jgi:HlyD family secretion protein
MKKNKKIILAAFLIKILIVFASSVIYKKINQSDKIILSGNIDIKELNASFRVSGRLKETYFDEGDLIKENDVLAILEKDTFENELNLANANLKSAEAILKNAKNNYQRSKKLFANNSISKQEYENDDFSYQKAEADFEAAKARFEIAKTALNDTTLTSPSAGFILTKAFEEGSLISAGQTIFNISLTDKFYARAYIEEKDLDKIKNGDLVKIITDSGSEYQGKIGFISSKAEFTPKTVETASLRSELVYRIRITIENGDEKLKQAMPITAEITL